MRLPRHGFSLSYPHTWEAQSDAPGAEATFVEPDSDLDATSFRSSLSVSAERLERKPDPGELFDAQLQTLALALTDPVLLDREDTTVADLPARYVLFAYRQGIWSLTLEQWYVLADRTAVVFSGTSTTDAWEETAPIVHRIVASFSPDGA